MMHEIKPTQNTAFHGEETTENVGVNDEESNTDSGESEHSHDMSNKRKLHSDFSNDSDGTDDEHKKQDSQLLWLLLPLQQLRLRSKKKNHLPS